MKTQTLHFIYVVIILVAAIIILVTTNWGAIPDIASLISFGLTLTSLVLSFVAIIFTFFSHFSFAQSTADLHRASQAISDTTRKLIEVSVPDLIKSVESVKEGQEQLKKTFIKEGESPQEGKPVGTIGEDVVRHFLKYTSYSGLLILYICNQSKQKTKQFKLENVKCNKDYAFGFIIACSSTGFFDYDSNNDVYIIKDINSHITKHIENAIKEKQKQLIDEDSKIFTQAALDKEIDEVNSLFS